MRMTSVLMLMAMACGGCAGQYEFTIPDQVAPAGGEATAVVRLTRSEIGPYMRPIKDACISMQVASFPLRGAYSDKDGYAAAAVPVPADSGVYQLIVQHMDKDGREGQAAAPLYVWQETQPLAAVEWEALPRTGTKEAEQAAAALAKIAQTHGLIYFTDRPTREHRLVHDQLKAGGYPDGPVLNWQRQYWHVEQANSQSMPRMIVEDRLVSQLPTLRLTFKEFKVGICQSDLAAKSFTQAGLGCMVVGPPKATSYKGPRVSWSDLASRGL